MIRGLFALVLLLSTASAQPQQPQIRIGVLGLFHPKELLLESHGSEALAVSGGDARFLLNGEPTHRSLRFRAVSDSVAVDGRSSEAWTAAARDGQAAWFELIVPGKFKRIYQGHLTVMAHRGELLAVVSMDRETVVASIVASEMNERTAIEALKAQAVAARSFVAAGARHQQFDFCDTTHCQFLRSPPSRDSRVWQAVHATRGMVLAYRGTTLAAMYSSRCGGQTRSLVDVGMNAGPGYPYFAVSCAYCLRHPVKWRSHIGDDGTAPRAGNENRRLIEARQWGWSAMPGSDFDATRDDAGWRIEGRSVGHGVGMCQYGAAGMAANGAGFREILEHYYPNTEVTAIATVR